MVGQPFRRWAVPSGLVSCPLLPGSCVTLLPICCLFEMDCRLITRFSLVMTSQLSCTRQSGYREPIT